MTVTAFVPFTVGRGQQPTFTVSGHPGYTVDHILLTETGLPLVLETGEFLLTA